jgi:hypothetical protein
MKNPSELDVLQRKIAEGRQLVAEVLRMLQDHPSLPPGTGNPALDEVRRVAGPQAAARVLQEVDQALREIEEKARRSRMHGGATSQRASSRAAIRAGRV